MIKSLIENLWVSHGIFVSKCPYFFRGISLKGWFKISYKCHVVKFSWKFPQNSWLKISQYFPLESFYRTLDLNLPEMSCLKLFQIFLYNLRLETYLKSFSNIIFKSSSNFLSQNIPLNSRLKWTCVKNVRTSCPL